MAATLMQRSAYTRAVGMSTKPTKPFTQRRVVVTRAQSSDIAAQDMGRRGALALLSGGVAFVSAAPSFAAYGDPANVFGRTTNTSGFTPYVGEEGFSMLIPARWNPSKEQEFANQVFRYEDNFDVVSNAVVLVENTTKKSIEDYGSPEQFLDSLSYLLGAQVYDEETKSEGGFAPGKIAAAHLIDNESYTDKSGKKFYKYQLLVRAANGNEGGHHMLISAAVSNNKLYVLRVQAGDKRWFKGAQKDAVGMSNSFSVA